MSPVDIVQRQLDAYNARDLDAFVATFHDNVAVFRPPKTEPSLSGRTALAHFYATERFNHVGLKAELVHRIALGSRVVDHERVWGLPDGPLEMVAIYEVHDGRIQGVWLFTG